MKISYNWLKEFIDTPLSPEEISGILTNIGLEVESLEKVQAVPGGLEGLVIAEVKECEQHPNADRLRVTKVDAGTGTELQVVCGAPNVAAGQKVVLAAVGTTVYPLEGEPFKINKSKIRGEISEGMICAEDEIGLGKSHDGIMVLSPDAVVGTPAKEYFKLEDDYLFEIGLTPNRADAASHLGVARDLAAYLRSSVKMPDVSAFKADNNESPVPVRIENKTACPRYSSISITGVEIKESPGWLKDRLNVIGVRPINNVVDITNYVLHELGQPLHAFDMDAVSDKEVVIKNCPEGTVFVTLDWVERKLSAEDLMICSGTGGENPMCIAGVFGGAGSGVKETTKNIFLESACFNPVSVRKTSKRHGLKTDASFRFERGTDPEITVSALKRAALLIKEIAGGEISSELSDIYPEPVKPFDVSFSYQNALRLIGQDIQQTEMKAIIKAVGIEIVSETADSLQLQVPAYKVDVTREVDVVEEILRIYGYNNIKIPTQVRASVNYSAKPDKEAVQHQLADMLTANGFFEILTNSLTKSAYADNAEQSVKILNPLSSDLDAMRQSLLYSGLEVVEYNQNRKNQDLKLYEFGTVYREIEGKYVESSRLALYLSGHAASEQWRSEQLPASFYQLKAAVDVVLKKLGLTELLIEDTQDSYLAYGLDIKKGGRKLVSFGSVKAALLEKLDIEKEVFYADFDFDQLLKSYQSNKIIYKEVPRYPSVRRDLSLLIDQHVTFKQLQLIAERTERKLLKGINVFDVYQGKNLPQGKKSYALSFTLQDEEKTLTDKQIDAIIQRLILNFEKEAGAEIRK